MSSPRIIALAGMLAILVSSVAATLPAAAAGDDPMTFRAGCSDGERVVIAAVGDILMHNSLQRQALTPKGSYQRFWQSLRPVLEGADITYGNLEGTLAPGVSASGRPVRDPGRRFDGNVYGSPRGDLNYNFHPSLAEDLLASGFDVVSTANNHAGDRGVLGVDLTAQVLATAGLAYTGTRARGYAEDRAWHVTTKAGGFNVAWIACTYATNGLPARNSQVLNCYRDREEIMSEIAWVAADPDIDAVILTPHWGIEKAAQPQARDRRLAREAIEAGATAVVGTHPHVLQGWEKVTAADGREGLVIYSTGNFISNQVSDDQRTGIIALIEISRGPEGRAALSAAGFIPTWVTRGQHRVDEMRVPAGPKGRRYSASLRRLPLGNHVTAATYRDLPRTCEAVALN